MAKIFSQLENAQVENKTSDYVVGTLGRFWVRSDTKKLKFDRGDVIADVLLNDDKLVIGTNVTAASNVRLYRDAANRLSLVKGDEATAEGAAPTALSELSSRLPNYTNAGKPANNIVNPGRAIWLTDLSKAQIDTGTIWIDVGTSGGSTLSWSKNSSNAPLTEYIHGIKFESFDKESLHEIYAIITVPSGYAPGSQIKLKKGQFFNSSTSGNVKFQTETALIGASTVLGTYPNKHNSTNSQLTVNAVADTVTSIGDLDLTNGSGLINGVAVVAGANLLVRLFRDNTNESAPAVSDARLLIDNFEIAFS